MAARRGDFDTAFRAFLAEDVREVHVIRLLAPVRFRLLRFPVGGRVPDEQVGRVFLLFQDAEDVVQRPDAEYGGFLPVDCLEGGLLGQDAAGAPLPDGHLDHRQGAGHRPDAAVQAQFPHDQVLLQSGQASLLRGGDDAEGDRKVIAAALFVQVGGGEVDDDFLAGNAEPLGLQGRDGPEQAFPDGGVGQADEVEADASGHFHFHSDGHGVDADAFGPVDIDEHVLRGLRFSRKHREKRRDGPSETEKCGEFFAYRRSQSSGFWGCRPDQSWKWNWFSPPMVSTAPSRSPVLTLSPALTVTFRSLQ